MPLFTIGLAILPSARSEDALHYKWLPGKRFAYDVTIVAEEPEKRVRYAGTIYYTVKEKGRLVYKGGLKKSVGINSEPVRTNQDQASPAFSAPFVPDAASADSAQRFKGLEQTTAEIVLNDHGSLISIAGNSHLPYFIGHLSLLPFEYLPDGKPDRWSRNAEIMLSKEADRIEMKPAPRLNPLFSSLRVEEKNPPGKVTEYRIVSAGNHLVTINKSCRVNALLSKEQGTMRVVQRGSWVFNRILAIPESMDLSHEVVCPVREQTMTIPVSIRMVRVSEDEVSSP